MNTLNVNRKKLSLSFTFVFLFILFIPLQGCAYEDETVHVNLYSQQRGASWNGDYYSLGYWDRELQNYGVSMKPNGDSIGVSNRGCCLLTYGHAVQALTGERADDSKQIEILADFLRQNNDSPNAEATYKQHLLNKYGSSYGISAANEYTGYNISWEKLAELFARGGVAVINPGGHFLLAVGFTEASINGQTTKLVQVLDSATTATIKRLSSGTAYSFSNYSTMTYANQSPKDAAGQYWITYSDFYSKIEIRSAFISSSRGTHYTSGTCGDDLSWEVDGSTLVITGSGAMKDYGIYGSPWYYHRNNITSVQLPAGLTKIGAHAFQDFVITNIDIPQSVTEIGEAAFERCYNLPTVTLPDNLKIIGSWVFRLSGITQINLPYTLESLGTHAFAETAITEVTLPASLTEIDGNPFNGLTGLTIKGYAGTAAETFANNNGFTFIYLAPVEVTGVSISGGDQLTIAEYDQYQLTALISPANATNRNVIWSSSNPNFAEVDQNGLVTAKEVGTCTITAVSESNPDVCASVTVSVTRHTHISEWVTVQPSTYQAEGLRECRCTLCGNLLEEEALPRLHIGLQEGSTWPGDTNNRTGYPAGNLQQGKGFGLRGVVIASENLVNVTGCVYSSSGDIALGPAIEEPYASSLDIEDSAINNDLAFNQLSEGMYRYTVTAQTVSGYAETLIDSLFSVGSAMVPSQTGLPADFCAYIRNQAKNLYLTNLQGDIAGRSFTGGPEQMWRFIRQSSGAYAIYSELNGSCMDVEGYSTANGARVYAYTGGYNGTTNQQFFIYYINNAYRFSPANTNSASVVDMDYTGYNLQIWTHDNADLDQRRFDIIQVKSTVQFSANGGSGAPSPIRRGYNESVMLPSRQPSRLGHVFVGWAETPDADSAAYLPGGQYTEKGDATLYAVWSPITVIYLPSGLTVLEEEAFANTQAACVICPENLTTIGPGAFANCTSLKQIYIPESVVTIDDTAFEGCNAPVDIWGIMDGYATKFVDAHTGFRFFAIE